MVIKQYNATSAQNGSIHIDVELMAMNIKYYLIPLVHRLALNAITNVSNPFFSDTNISTPNQFEPLGSVNDLD